MTPIQQLLQELNTRMLELHACYEDLFWIYYMDMRDHSVEAEKSVAEEAVSAFRADAALSARVDEALKGAEGEEKEHLLQWQKFFSCYQAPAEVLSLRKQATEVEARVMKDRGARKEGYIDPVTGEFVKSSRVQMRLMIATNPDEAVRKACHEAVEALAIQYVPELIEMVSLRNAYARGLGYKDFYDYKLQTEEGMTKDELVAIFDDVFERTKQGFDLLRELEVEKPGLRLPWNRAYLLSGDFKKKEDPYLDLSNVLQWWGESFAALGISYQGATLQLDLLQRDGKYDNGFCHWPGLVHFIDGVRVPGRSNFTCTAVPGQVGSGAIAAVTLFHEGGHAAHLTNVETSQMCMNHEYAPMSPSWAEVHSMFLDTMQSSPEWLCRYAHDDAGNAYPFSLYEEGLRQRYPNLSLRLMDILMVSEFERALYATPDLTEALVLALARRVTEKYSDYGVDSHYVLGVPHIYSWTSAAYYHGYGLAELTLEQWREYFYKKYGYIVDNPAVATEMYEVWKLGASKTFREFVKLATGKPLSADAYVHSVTGSVEDMLAEAKTHIEQLADVSRHEGPVELDATIKMVHGKDVIADNTESFEAMVATYRDWYLCLVAKKAA